MTSILRLDNGLNATVIALKALTSPFILLRGRYMIKIIFRLFLWVNNCPLRKFQVEKSSFQSQTRDLFQYLRFHLHRAQLYNFVTWYFTIYWCAVYLIDKCNSIVAQLLSLMSVVDRIREMWWFLSGHVTAEPTTSRIILSIWATNFGWKFEYLRNKWTNHLNHVSVPCQSDQVRHPLCVQQ